jgi:peptide chain release factor subunit 1
MSKTSNSEEEHERLVEQWKIRNLVKRLSKARGNGTSMISLVIPPKDQISRVNKMLQDEYGTASNIKSRVNRLSVLSAITSTRERLKRYNKVPPNGLVIYVGTVMTEDGKEKKVSIHFEPFKPINTSLYLCDNKFHVEPLEELLESSAVFGFIIMDGNGCLYGTLSGNTCKILQKFTVELPKKHGRGGQSAVRFARLRVEKRQNYVRKCAEHATQHFIVNNERANVEGIVLAGSASFKNDLFNSDIFDPRLKTIVIKIVDTSYGGENGFNQAIELSKEALANVKFIREKQLLNDYMQEIAKDTNRYCFGIRDSMRALEMGSIKTLLVWENLELVRFVLKNPNTNETKEMYLTPKEGEETDFLNDKKSGVTWDIIEQEELLEWLANNYKKYGSQLEFVTDRSQEGAQFVKGFGGIGGFLRYQINFAELEDYMDKSDEEYEEDGWI